ncbi:MAG: photosystem II S4 domain protein [Firmicutes bacterium]|nr:photosystem II S4 domain protein [Bacillota bacterium]
MGDAVVERLLALGREALRREAALPAEFFSPEERAVLSRELAVLPGLRALFYGGYRRASRQRLVLAPEYLLAEAIDPGLACFSITAADRDRLSEEACLAALIALGLPRGMIGDLIPVDGGCQAVLAAEYAEAVQDGLRRIGGTEVTAAAIEPEALQAPPIQEKTIHTTVASPRLDAVAADGFGVSRTRMARLIKAGIVRVNWQPAARPDRLLVPGDVISIRGRGRVVVVSVAGETKKGRLGLVLRRVIC